MTPLGEWRDGLPATVSGSVKAGRDQYYQASRHLAAHDHAIDTKASNFSAPIIRTARFQEEER